MPASWEIWLRRLFGGIAALLLFAMMALTFADVLLRYWFNAPLPGAFEVTELLLASLVFLGWPLVTLHREHVSVDLFERLLPRALRAPRDLLVQLLCAVCAAVLCWRMWHKAMDSLNYGDITSVLELPRAPVFFLGCVALGATALVFVALLWRQLRGRSGGAAPGRGQ